MKTFLALTTAILLGIPVFPAEQTWSGEISDSACGVTHPEDPDAAGGGTPGPPDPRECTEACVRGGSKYVFVSKDTVFQIANQNDPALAAHAGQAVRLTGELKNDTITVSKIEKP